MIQDKSDEKIKKQLSSETSGEKNSPHVLLAEDDDEMRKLLAWALRKEGYYVTECPDGIRMLDHLDSFLLRMGKSEDVDLIISDIRMPGVTGLEILERVHQLEGFPPMILITAFGDEETHAQAQRLGAVAMFDKPFDIEDLLAKVREVVSPQSASGDKPI